MNLSNHDFHIDSRRDSIDLDEDLRQCIQSPRPSELFKHRNSNEIFLDVLPKSSNTSFDLSDSFSLCEFRPQRKPAYVGSDTPDLEPVVPTTDTTPVKLDKNSFVFNAKIVRAINTSNKSEISTTKTGCNCKKTKCLKLYCECFANGGVCSIGCKCDNCHNTNDLQDLRELIIQETLEKNPLAFKSKYKSTQDKDRVLHSRGCRCSKAGCQKNYCECYSKGLGCSRLCRCENCQNQKIDLKDEEVGMYYDRVLRKRKKPNYIYEFYFNKYFNLKNRTSSNN